MSMTKKTTSLSTEEEHKSGSSPHKKPTKKGSKATSKLNSHIEKKPDKDIKYALALLSENQLSSLKNYGMFRPQESKAFKAGSNLPSDAEMALMLLKANAESELEAKKQLKIKELKKAEEARLAKEARSNRSKQTSGLVTPKEHNN